MARVATETYTELLENGDTINRIRETTIKSKLISGWNMTYKRPLYDFIEKLSPAKFKIYRCLEDMLMSTNGYEVKISPKVLADSHKCHTADPGAITKLLTMMVKHNIIMETKPKHYLYNPHVALPQYADGELLQKEWKDRGESGNYKRRGRTILDEYYEYKKMTNDPKLTMKEYVEMVLDETQLDYITPTPGIYERPKQNQ